MNSVEIAKRVFVDGLELSSISPVEITSGLEGNYNFPSLLLSMEERGIYTTENENIVKVLASRTPNYRTSLDVALFPMAPALNWVLLQNETIVSIEKDPDSFWNGKPYPLISQLFYIYIKQRIKRSIESMQKALTPIVELQPETMFTCKTFKFSSSAQYLCLQYIAHTANEMSNDILSRISLVGEQAHTLDNSLESQVEKSRNVRRTIGMINTIFELEGFMVNHKTCKYLDRKVQSNRIILEVVNDIKAMFT
jgi:hypothetical protein